MPTVHFRKRIFSTTITYSSTVTARKGGLGGGAPPEIYKEIRFFLNVFNFLLKIPSELVDLFILCQNKFIVCKGCSNRTYPHKFHIIHSPFLGEDGQHGARDRVYRVNAT
jgi:hypothetical protein